MQLYCPDTGSHGELKLLRSCYRLLGLTSLGQVGVTVSSKIASGSQYFPFAPAGRTSLKQIKIDIL